MSSSALNLNLQRSTSFEQNSQHSQGFTRPVGEPVIVLRGRTFRAVYERVAESGDVLETEHGLRRFVVVEVVLTDEDRSVGGPFTAEQQDRETVHGGTDVEVPGVGPLRGRHVDPVTGVVRGLREHVVEQLRGAGVVYAGGFREVRFQTPAVDRAALRPQLVEPLRGVRVGGIALDGALRGLDLEVPDRIGHRRRALELYLHAGRREGLFRGRRVDILYGHVDLHGLVCDGDVHIVLDPLPGEDHHRNVGLRLRVGDQVVVEDVVAVVNLHHAGHAVQADDVVVHHLRLRERRVVDHDAVDVHVAQCAVDRDADGRRLLERVGVVVGEIPRLLAVQVEEHAPAGCRGLEYQADAHAVAFQKVRREGGGSAGRVLKDDLRRRDVEADVAGPARDGLHVVGPGARHAVFDFDRAAVVVDDVVRGLRRVHVVTPE